MTRAEFWQRLEEILRRETSVIDPADAGSLADVLRRELDSVLGDLEAE